MRHRWVSEQRFAELLLEMVDTYNRLGFPEPIPVPDAERIARAGGMVASVNEPVFGIERFEKLPDKVSYVYYELTKQHFFVNGNKRIATYFLLRLLEIHELTLNVAPDRLADLTEWVAASSPQDRDGVLRTIEKRVSKNLGPIEGWPDAGDLYERRKTKRYHTR